MSNPSARLATLAAALKFTHPGASLALLDLVEDVRRQEITIEYRTAEAMQQDIDQEAARRVGFSSRHHEAMQTLRRAAGEERFTDRPDAFDRPEYLQRGKGDPA